MEVAASAAVVGSVEEEVFAEGAALAAVDWERERAVSAEPGETASVEVAWVLEDWAAERRVIASAADLVPAVWVEGARAGSVVAVSEAQVPVASAARARVVLEVIASVEPVPEALEEQAQVGWVATASAVPGLADLVVTASVEDWARAE